MKQWGRVYCFVAGDGEDVIDSKKELETGFRLKNVILKDNQIENPETIDVERVSGGSCGFNFCNCCTDFARNVQSLLL